MPSKPFDAAQFATSSREEVVGRVPFTVRRAARWAECDPAGVVYTGHFTEYMLSAVHLFRQSVLGADWRELRRDLRIDTPAKALNIVFNGSLWPDNVFDTRIYVGEIRSRTFDFLADAVRTESELSVFRGRLTAICVSADDRTVSAVIPDQLRERLERERSSSPAPGNLMSELR